MSAFGRSLTLPAIALVCVFAGCGPRSAAPPVSRTNTAAAAAGRAVAPASASPEHDGQWTMPAKDYANTRYTPGVFSLLAGCLAAAVLIAVVLRVGAIDLGMAKALWGGLCLVVLVAIVLRARRHWDGWRARQTDPR